MSGISSYCAIFESLHYKIIELRIGWPFLSGYTHDELIQYVLQGNFIIAEVLG
ncbi:hypothetical protein RYX36_016121 [Vicia faba]